MTEHHPEVQRDIGQDQTDSKPSDDGLDRPDQSDDFEAQVDAVDHDEAGA